MELEQVLHDVLRLDDDPKATDALQTLMAEHPQWKDQITDCWEMHRELTITRRTIKAKLPANWGPYEILDEIDRGGMGVVYRARHKDLDRIVALKIIRSGDLADEAEIARFRREAQVAANLLHPNIIPIYEVGQEKQLVYFTMAFIDGMPLSKFASNPNFSIPAKVNLIHELAHALHYAHGQGIAHRDIKPSNIIVDVQGKPVLIDFGLAKLTHNTSDLTISGAILGTPTYMAPEQRYTSALEFAEDLNRWMEGSAIQTPTTSLWVKAVRWWRQEPGLFSHLTAISIVTMIVSLSHWLGYSQSNLTQQLFLLISWFALCIPLQHAVFQVKNTAVPAVLWGLIDVAFVSLLIANAQAPRSLLLAAYPLMITVSALFYRTRFVLLMTIACIVAFVMLTETLSDPSMDRTDFRLIFISLLLVQCLTLTSLIFKVRNLFSHRNP